MEKNFHKELTILREKIYSSKRIAIASHMNPDGDNLGSKLCLYKFFINLKKEVYVIENDEVPTAEKFLPGVVNLVNSDAIDNLDFDLMIVTDCGDLERIGKASKVFHSAGFTVNIDHHPTNTNFAELNIVDEDSSAVCELIFILLKEMGFDVDKDMATCLYTGLSTDTGSFKYDSIRPETFQVAKELLEIGIDTNEIVVNLYQRRTKEKTALLLQALKTIKYYNESKIALVYICDEDIKSTGARKSDSDGIVEFVRDIDGVELAIFIKEKEDSYRLSTRSKTFVNCSDIAKKFNGGGHIRAAGGTIYKKDYPKLDLAINAVIKAAKMEF